MKKNIQTILNTVIQEEKDNTIQSYTYDGLEIQQSERVIMRKTLLLHLFNADSFLTLRCKKHPEVEYDSFRNSLEMLFISGISHEGRLYKLLGAGSSLKDGKVLLATDDVITTLQPQFSNCAELLSYMGIYTSSNSFGIYDLVYSLGIMEQAYQCDGIISEDGMGFIPISLIEELNLPIRQLQVRIVGENWQCKGTLHPYEGDKVLLDPTMIKGKNSPKNGEQFFIMGIREIARPLRFKSNWTMLQFFSESTINSTIPALELELDRLEDVLTDRNKTLKFIGTIEDQDDRFKLESYLKSGLEPHHPYLANALRKHLRARLKDLALGSSVNQMGFMASAAQINPGTVCNIDLPEGNYTMTRFPIRDYSSFVPVRNNHNLVCEPCSGSIYIANEDALTLDGDYDGDYMVLIDNDQILEEVKSPEFGSGYKRIPEGKKVRREDPLEYLPFVGAEAVSGGAKIGYTTLLINSAIMSDKHDLIPELSASLQNEVQSLKWDTGILSQNLNELAKELEVMDVYRECKFNKSSFISHIPCIDEGYVEHYLFEPYRIVQSRFKFMYPERDLLHYRYRVPLHNYDTSACYEEVSSVQRLFNGWISDILQEYKAEDSDPTEALQTPINFLKVWSASKQENRKEYAAAVWSATHIRRTGSIGSFAFHCFENEMLALIRGTSDEPQQAVPVPILSEMKTLRAVGGYYSLSGSDISDKLRRFKSMVKSIGRTAVVEIKPNDVDPQGLDFHVGEFRLGSLPRDMFDQYSHLQIGDRFESLISFSGKVVYLHTI